jgi:hypothetical protein
MVPGNDHRHDELTRRAGLDLISVNKVKIVTLADKQKQSVNPNAAIARTTSEYGQK